MMMRSERSIRYWLAKMKEQQKKQLPGTPSDMRLHGQINALSWVLKLEGFDY